MGISVGEFELTTAPRNPGRRPQPITVACVPLQSSSEHPQPLRVVTNAVRGWIDRLGAVWVEAQLIELNRRTGNRLVFLTLRDTLAGVSVSVTISPLALEAAGPLSEGATVVAHIKPTYYEASGRLTFACDALTAVGEGRLLARLEQTKRLLQAEGLFDPARKRPLPYLPRGLGLITGQGSAAERDVVENARRRWPAVRIVTRHVLVQGAQAAEQVIAAVRDLDRHDSVDVIVIARGGGSVEDLLPFSDEGLVRAVFAARTPVVSAIGHETDTTILDLVADLRASTPTDAAKRVVPDLAEELVRLRHARARLDQAIHQQVRRQQDWLDDVRSRPVLADPTASLKPRYELLGTLRQRAHRALAHRLDRDQDALRHHLARLRALSPQATLRRGYAILTDSTGRDLTSVQPVEIGTPFTARLSDGDLAATVTEIHPRPSGGR
jgi:exodeoxyribonuclease VII large subunit